MYKRVARFGLHKTAATIAVMNFFLGIIYMIIAIIAGLVQGMGPFVLLFLLVPFVVAIVSYIIYGIAYWFYNLAAKVTGGVVFKLVDKEEKE